MGIDVFYYGCTYWPGIDDFCYERVYWTEWDQENICMFMGRRNVYDLFKEYSFEEYEGEYLFVVYGANTGKIRHSIYEVSMKTEGEITVLYFKYCEHPRWQVWRMPLTYREIDDFMYKKLDAMPMIPLKRYD